MKFQLQNISIPRLIAALVLLLALVVMIIIVFIFININNQRVEIDVSGRNRMLSQKMVLLANLYVNSDKDAKKLCLETLELHENSIQTMKFGGQAPAMAEGKTIKAAEGETKVYLNKVERLWQKYRNNLYIILEQPLYIDTLIKQESFLSNRPDTLGVQKARMLNPQVQKSLSFLNSNFTRMLQTNDDLVKAYIRQNKKRELFLEVFLIFAFVIILALITFSLYLLKIHVFNPIRKITAGAEKIVEGKYDENLDIKGKNEFGKLATILNILFEKIGKAQSFIQAIGAGKLNTDISEIISNKNYQQDLLFKSLITAQEQLKKVEDENQIRNWLNEGLARLDVVLRENTELQKLGKDFLRHLIDYIKIEQGAIFIIEQDKFKEDKKFLQMIANYAYQREKFVKKQIPLGRGIVSEVFLEGKSQLFDSLPENYLTFQSGLGEAKIPHLLIVPITNTEESLGVIELSSFNKFEKHTIEFVEHLGENLGTALYNLLKTQEMQELYMASKKLTEELRTQEEEMRQNMEELAATQEEMRNNERKYLEKNKELEKLYHNSQEMTQVLEKSREELKQNMEELVATQEEMRFKEQFYIQEIERLKKAKEENKPTNSTE